MSSCTNNLGVVKMAEIQGTQLAALVPEMVVDLGTVQRRMADLRQFIKLYMVQDEDFGIIPGTPRPTLLKPGAEKLCDVYGFAKTFEVVQRIEDWDKGFFHYEVKAVLTSKRTGVIEAEGLGSCNTKEKRYAARWVSQSKLPQGVEPSTLKSRERTGRNGKYNEYLLENDDTFSLVNTILKMAKKRALVDAVLSATRSSGMFTQDVEDFVDDTLSSDSGATNKTNQRPSNSNNRQRATQQPAVPALPEGFNSIEEQSSALNLFRDVANSLGLSTGAQLRPVMQESLGKAVKVEVLSAPELHRLIDHLDSLAKNGTAKDNGISDMDLDEAAQTAFPV